MPGFSMQDWPCHSSISFPLSLSPSLPPSLSSFLYSLFLPLFFFTLLHALSEWCFNSQVWFLTFTTSSKLLCLFVGKFRLFSLFLSLPLFPSLFSGCHFVWPQSLKGNFYFMNVEWLYFANCEGQWSQLLPLLSLFAWLLSFWKYSVIPLNIFLLRLSIHTTIQPTKLSLSLFSLFLLFLLSLSFIFYFFPLKVQQNKKKLYKQKHSNNNVAMNATLSLLSFFLPLSLSLSPEPFWYSHWTSSFFFGRERSKMPLK